MASGKVILNINGEDVVCEITAWDADVQLPVKIPGVEAWLLADTDVLWLFLPDGHPELN